VNGCCKTAKPTNVFYVSNKEYKNEPFLTGQPFRCLPTKLLGDTSPLSHLDRHLCLQLMHRLKLFVFCMLTFSRPNFWTPLIAELKLGCSPRLRNIPRRFHNHKRTGLAAIFARRQIGYYKFILIDLIESCQAFNRQKSYIGDARKLRSQ
jgi:hypothetical protein